MPLTAIALAQLITAAAPACHDKKAQPIAEAIFKAAPKYGVDPLLLAAVVLVETRGTCGAAIGDKDNGGCSVSPWQIYSPHCSARHVTRFSNLFRAASQAAKILILGKRICEEPGRRWYCKIHWAGRYNGGSRRWLASTLGRWRQLKSLCWGSVTPIPQFCNSALTNL